MNTRSENKCQCGCVPNPQANLAIQEGRHRVAANELQKAESQLSEKEAEFQVVQAKCDAAVKEKQVQFDGDKKKFNAEIDSR